MRRLVRSLNQVDPGVRWALVPVGIAASLFVSSLVDAAFVAVTGLRSSPGTIHVATGAFIGAATRTLFPAVLSPRPWPVALIMFALDFLLRAGPPAYRLINYEYMRARAATFMGQLVADIVAGIAGGLLGLYLLQRVMPAKTQHPTGN